MDDDPFGDNDGWGNVPAKKSSYGKGSAAHDEDDLENMLGDLETKKGIDKEKTKPA